MKPFDPFKDLPHAFFLEHRKEILNFGWVHSGANNVRPAFWHETKDTSTYLYRKLLSMAKQADKDKKKYVKPKSVTWVNYSLTADDNLAIDGWDASPVEILTGILALHEARLEYVFKPSEDGSTFSAFLFNNELGNPDYGLGMSSKSTEALDCLKVLLYKHHSVFNEQWSAGMGDRTARPKRS